MPINMKAPAPAGGRAARRLRQRRHVQRIAVLVLLVLALALGAVFIATAHTSSAHASATRYGPDPDIMSKAVQTAGWPQQHHIWCGVAAITAVADFRGAGVSQQAVADAVSGGGTQSEWGTPGPSSDAWGPGFQADISRDAGLDPRAHAAGLASVTHAGYHEAVDYTGPWTATSHLVADLLRSQEPIAAIVEHGAHSVVVAGVYANGDPHNLNDVTALDVWDPGVGSVDDGVQGAQEAVISLNTWLYGWSYWGGTYSENWQGGRMLDPDPAVGPYTYDPAAGRNRHLWVGHYVYIRPDAGGDAASGVSPDWAFNQNDALIRGLNGEVPAGYTGPSVALYTPPPPPPPTPTPLPTATPTPVYEATPRGQPAKPTLPPYDADASLTPTAAAQASPPAQATPAAGSALSFSLQHVCIGSSCTPGAAWALGGAFLLGLVLLALIGAILLRRRARQVIPIVPVIPAASAIALAQPELSPDLSNVGQAGGSATAQSAPPADVSIAEGGSAEEPDALSAPTSAATVEGSGPGDAVSEPGIAEEDVAVVGSLARLAGAASRLDGLAEGAPLELAPTSIDPTSIDSAEADDRALADLAAELISQPQPAVPAPSQTPDEAEVSEVVSEGVGVAPSASEQTS